MPPLVSILIPVYNAEAWLTETLECALAQTWANKEIIVVDDGSTDGSLQVARRFEGPNVQLISQENRGGCAARNRALAEAQGDFIQYLDADDLMAPNKLEVQVQRLEKAPVGRLAAGRWDRFYDTSGNASVREVRETVDTRDKPYYDDYEKGLDWAVRAMSHQGMFPPHAWLTPRRVAEEAGAWDESLRINQDGEYFNRVALASEGVAFCNEAQVYYRSGRDNSVSQKRSPAILKSKYHSIERIANQILAEANTAHTRRACAIGFKTFAHEAYPDVPDTVEQALRHADQLGGASRHSFDSALYQRLCDVLGWKAAKRLRRWYYQVRYGKTI